MYRRTFSRITIAAVAAVLGVAAWAWAGTVRLVNSDYADICKLEIMIGDNAPKSGAVTKYDHVKKGVVASGAGQLCFRRSADPGNCASALTEWRCAFKGTSGVQDFRLY